MVAPGARSFGIATRRDSVVVGLIIIGDKLPNIARHIVDAKRRDVSEEAADVRRPARVVWTLSEAPVERGVVAVIGVPTPNPFPPDKKTCKFM